MVDCLTIPQENMNDVAELELIGVSKCFGGVHALSDVSIGFDSGKITCIIGPNGAGKTTLFNLITGNICPDTGEIRFKGEALQGRPSHLIARKGIGRLFQDIRIFRKMTAFANVCVAAQHQPGERILFSAVWPLVGWGDEALNQKMAMEHLEFVGLGEFANRLGEELSYGQQKLLAIARLLNSEASCFLLDEPTAGVQPEMVAKLTQVIRGLTAKGHSVVVIEHDLGIVGELADWVFLMDRGRIEAFGTPSEILRDSSLERLIPIH